ncbi:MAG TPA: C4-type zinc ribbon domain-containing protein [Candidatus Acidoferrum sp.]|jgi:predicted  nucleic acid-binding Zn-ribbon protein|nr:C4-type zinc ribbon domain-containing protein [Candidatus Acidoferrum sp.]
MNPAQLLLRYQAQVERERAVRDVIVRLESRLASDPDVVALEESMQEARAAQDAVAARLRESDHTREDHRSKLRTREKELMSGRIRNPTELMQMSDEVAHMRARFAEEEDAELTLMEDAEAADDAMRTVAAGLAAAKSRSAAEEPALNEELEAGRAELAEIEAERDEIWSQVPPAAQAAYKRTRAQPPVARVVGNQCTACRVTVTSSGMQTLRKGLDELVHCEHCSRILVLA